VFYFSLVYEMFGDWKAEIEESFGSCADGGCDGLALSAVVPTSWGWFGFHGDGLY